MRDFNTSACRDTLLYPTSFHPLDLSPPPVWISQSLHSFGVKPVPSLSWSCWLYHDLIIISVGLINRRSDGGRDHEGSQQDFVSHLTHLRPLCDIQARGVYTTFYHGGWDPSVGPAGLEETESSKFSTTSTEITTSQVSSVPLLLCYSLVLGVGDLQA